MKSTDPATKELNKLFSGSIISFVGQIINSGAQYLLILILGRVLGPAEVGMFFLGRAIMRFAGTGGTFGLSGSLLKFIPEYLALKRYDSVHRIIRFAYSSSFLVSAAIAAILYTTAPYLSMHLFRDHNLISVIRLFSIGIPAFTILIVIATSIRAFRDMIGYSIVENMVLPIGIIGYTLLFFIYSKDIEWVVIAFLLSILTSIVVGYNILKKKLPRKGEDQFDKLNVKEIVNYSIPFMGSDYMGLTLLWMDTFMIGIFMDMEAVGIYNGAIKIALLSKIILLSINSIFGPTISKLYAKGDMAGIEIAYKTTVRWIIHLSLPFYLLIFAFSKQIMGLYGPEFTEGSTALIILGTGQLVSLSVGSAGSLLNMTGKPKVEFFNRSLGLVLNFLLNLYLIPIMGITGSALATASSTSLVNILRLIENYRFLNIHPYSLKLLNPFYRK